MSEMFNQKTFLYYQSLLGKDDLLSLWKTFLTEATAFSAQVNSSLSKKDFWALRFLYHRLKPSSQVFGLDSFALLCAKIEQDILHQNFNNLKQDVSQSLVLLDKGISLVDSYWNKS